MFYIGFSSYLLSDEIIDCSQFDKISAKYVECKAKNLKSNLNKQQSKMKSKVDYRYLYYVCHFEDHTPTRILLQE